MKRDQIDLDEYILAGYYSIMSSKSFLRIIKNYENNWVALSQYQKRVISSGKTLSDVESKLSKDQLKKVILYRVPPLKVSFSG